MADFSGMLNTQLMLFLLLGLGMLTAKLGLVDEKGCSMLSSLVVTVILPCNIVSSFLITFSASVLQSIGLMLGVSFCILALSIGLNTFLYRKAPPKQQPVLKYGTLVPNSTFVGLPLVEGIYGTGATVYASIYVLPLRVAMWSVGLGYFAAGKSKGGVKKILTHPCIVATALGLVLMLTGLRPPVFIVKSLSAVGGCLTTFSMLVVGNILGRANVKSLFSGWALF